MWFLILISNLSKKAVEILKEVKGTMKVRLLY